MNPKKKTKIIATIGPSTNNYDTLFELYKSGVNAFRLNFSHGTHEDHLKVILLTQEIIKKEKAAISIIADLQGPKLRIGKIKDGSCFLKDGQHIKVSIEQVEGTENHISVSYDKLVEDILPGELILIDDGKIELKAIQKIDDKNISCEIVNGGVLSSNKGFNLPNTNTSVPSITEKDWKDLHFIITQPIPWIALSFVRTAAEIIELKQWLISKGSSSKVIAKIEKPEAVENIDTIIAVTDAVMIARGDLGVEVPMEEMPLIQKNIIQKSIKLAKPVIIATQVMESMLETPRPSRAEITDVANGVLDGADAIMLSGETSVGKYPVKVVQTITKIIQRTEQEDSIYYHKFAPSVYSPTFLSDSICFNACKIAQDVQAKAINGMTYSGYTAFMLASFRPKADIFIFTSNHELTAMLSLVWGVEVFYYDKFEGTDETIQDIMEILKHNRKVSIGDNIINTASMPIKGKGRTNMIKISCVE